MVEEASLLALVGAKEHGVRVSFDFDPATGAVMIDKVQIQQVLVNLITNSVYAMPDGGEIAAISMLSSMMAPNQIGDRWSASMIGK